MSTGYSIVGPPYIVPKIPITPTTHEYWQCSLKYYHYFLCLLYGMICLDQMFLWPPWYCLISCTYLLNTEIYSIRDGKLLYFLNSSHKGGYRVKGKGRVVSMHNMKTYRGCGTTAPLILNLGTWWRWAVSLMAQPLYHRERTPSTH
jgi:hypothetical protein